MSIYVVANHLLSAGVVGIDDDAVVAAAIGRPGSWKQVSSAILRERASRSRMIANIPCCCHSPRPGEHAGRNSMMCERVVALRRSAGRS